MLSMFYIYLQSEWWYCFLASKVSSPISLRYIKSLASLSKTQLDNLFSYIDNSRLSKRNRLIFSITLENFSKGQEDLCRSYLENRLSCLTLRLPPLRERINDLSSITAVRLVRRWKGGAQRCFNQFCELIIREVEWRGNALKRLPWYSGMQRPNSVWSPVKSAERCRNRSSWRKLSRGGRCILYAGGL